METINRKPKGCKSSKKAWEREHEHGRRESCKLTVDCVLNSVSFSGFGRKTECLSHREVTTLHLDNCTVKKDLNGKASCKRAREREW